MKPLNRRLAFLILMILSVSFSAWAQDAGLSDVDLTEGRDASATENVVFTPGEDLRYIPRMSGSTIARDSIILQMHDFPMQRAAQKPAEKANEKQPAKKDDSILTYNFLYYIIQKYKLQDIID